MKFTIKFLFFTTLLMASISSYAQCVRIVGAGDTAVNGNYEIVAGQTYYKHITANYWMDKNTNGYWAIFSQVNAPGSSCGCGHYYSDNSGSDPATSGTSWSTASGGSSPVPTSGDCLPDDSCELSTSQDTVCFGNSTTLSIITGSKLVNGSNWYWYRDSLNTTPIDSSASIVVTPPNANTTYYCRSESSSTSFTGDSSLITIIIKNTSGKPIISGCGNSNDTITLAKDSNSLATYFWGVSKPGNIWDTLGSAGFSAGQAGYTSLAMDTIGTPYVLYMDGGNSNKATVMKYNGTAWVTVGNAGFSSGMALYTSLAIDASGTPYAAYRDAANSDKATVMKYNGTAWVTVGNAGFSAGRADYTSLAIDTSGTPYLGYADVTNLVNSRRATVMKYNGSAWVTVGNAGLSDGKVYNTSLAIDVSGTPYLGYRDEGNGYKATVYEFYPGIASTGFEVTDTSQMIYLTATYPNGCIVNADPIKASDTEPAAIPFIAGTTYQSNAIVNDGSWLHYCDCDNGYRLLSLDITGSGAVVPADSVWLRLGSKKTQSWTNSGGMVTNSKGGAMIVRKWEVSPSTQPTSDVGVKHYFTQDEFLALQDTLANHNGGTSGYATTLTDPTDMQMYKITSSGKFANPHNSGVTGIVLVNNTTAGTDNWVYAPHNSGHSAEFKVSTFSGGGGGGGAGGNPLPVELIHFDAQAAANHTADLHWATASEINNNYFDVERSYNGETFETVGQVDGNGTTNQRLDYNFIDESIRTTEMNVFYRLKQVDFDGVFEYSDVRVVRFDGKVEMLEIAAYPNPFNQELTIRISTAELYSIEVTDLNGLVMLNIEREDKGTHSLDLSTWASGVYIVNVISTQGTKHLKVMKH
ncbi:T9SS type A sorting domain-containing protein [Bacteroidia bacterium]|nr:T9SS type A sorting domain-containing protein [Bacteroidia bacterium]